MTRVNSRLAAALNPIGAAVKGPKPQAASAEASGAVQDRLDIGSEKLSETAVNDIVLGGVRSSLQDALAKAGVETSALEDLAAPADSSAEATAQRIVAAARGAFSSFNQAHPELSGQEVRARYSSVVSQAVNQGVDRAAAVLKGLSILMNGELFNKVERTRSLVNNMVSSF